MIKVNKKDILNTYYNVISIGYCSLQYLLKCNDSKMHTCGTYGWNANVYHINNNTCIVTGYRPFGNIYPKYEITKKYEGKAREIYCNNELKWSQKEKKLEKLLDKFIKEVINNESRD